MDNKILHLKYLAVFLMAFLVLLFISYDAFSTDIVNLFTKIAPK